MNIEQKTNYFRIAKKAFEQNQNIVETLVKNGANKSDSIEIAYDLQAGSYTRNFNTKSLIRNKEIHSIINKYTNLPDINSIGVFGVGEAKNWIGYDGKINSLFGVELSYSRIRYAYENLQKVSGINSFNLIKGDASEKIFKENSFDISITLHSIEPNGNEQGSVILKNVIESSSKYILLFEPDFLTAHDEMKKRMLKHDYVRNISDEIDKINSVNLIEHFVINNHENMNNLTTCWIIEKKSKKPSEKQKMICPFSHETLIDYKDMMFSPNTGLAYPKINEITLLNKNDAIFLGNIK